MTAGPPPPADGGERPLPPVGLQPGAPAAPSWPPPPGPYGPPGPPFGYAPPYAYGPYHQGGPYNPGYAYAYGPAAARPRGPAPGLVYAGAGLRIVAAIIDIIVKGVLALAFALAAGAIVAATGATAVAVGLLVAGGIVLYLGYEVWFPGRYGGTPAMRLFDMRILREADGSQIGYALAAGRWAIFTVLGLFYLIGQIVNVVVLCMDDRRQTIQDKACSTLVVKPGW